MGPVTPSSVDGFRYFVTFIDEYSSHACGKFMRTKNEVYRKFKDYLPTTVLHVYCGQTMAPSIQTESLRNFVLTTKSKVNTQPRLVYKLALSSDTHEL